MDFDHSDEQRLLAETVGRFVVERCDFESRLKTLATPEGWSRHAWHEMAELGLLALPFAEADGGFGGGGVETMIVMEALGRGLVLEPYLATVVLGGGVLRRAASAEQRAARLPELIAGAHVMTLAHQEPRAPRHGLAVTTRAHRNGSDWALSGRKIAVLHGAAADEIVVSAATAAGLSLFLVPTGAAGVSRRAQRGYDGVPVAEIAFDKVKLPADALIGIEGLGGEILTEVFEEANAALAAEAVGIMADTLDVTVEYLKTRNQFGVPIGSFQALQHRTVDMLMQVELARSMAILAALSLDQPAEQRRRNIAAAKVQIGRAGRFIGQQAVQLHGAIGITAEYKVGHAFKRLTAIDALFGDADHHLDMLTEVGGLGVDQAA
jgi:alkylation response protein AidB-like acyl-CoA dehydrogenase